MGEGRADFFFLAKFNYKSFRDSCTDTGHNLQETELGCFGKS